MVDAKRAAFGPKKTPAYAGVFLDELLRASYLRWCPYRFTRVCCMNHTSARSARAGM